MLRKYSGPSGRCRPSFDPPPALGATGLNSLFPAGGLALSWSHDRLVFSFPQAAMLRNLYGETRIPRSQGELNIILAAHERYASHRGGIRAQLVHANLNGLNLANRNLPEADFAGASLAGARMCGSNLERASLYCADLRDCNLQSARLARADLRGALFKGARLSHAVLDNADLRAAMMTALEAAATAVVAGAPVKLDSGVDFSRCSLKNVSFGNARLDGADFSGALLHGASFRGAVLTNATFKDAVLTGVNLGELGVPPEALSGCVRDVTDAAAAKYDALKARLDGHHEWIMSSGARGAPANFDGEDLRPLGTLFAGRMLGGLSARGTLAIGIDFSGTQLQAAKFDGADIRDANFSGGDLRGISLRNARLSHARFNRANLGRLMLTSGVPLYSNLTGADVSPEQFLHVVFDDDLPEFGMPRAAEVA
jgi:uncharacterized protein YjbI with pentapeptide repeats